MTGPRLASLERAVDRLAEALAQPETGMNRDASIQRFEFCFELAWKAIQERLHEGGTDCRSPKGCLREAYRQDWLTDETGWIAMLDDRNLTAHTYDETFACNLYQRLAGHLTLLRALRKCLGAQME